MGNSELILSIVTFFLKLEPSAKRCGCLREACILCTTTPFGQLNAVRYSMLPCTASTQSTHPATPSSNRDPCHYPQSIQKRRMYFNRTHEVPPIKDLCFRRPAIRSLRSKPQASLLCPQQVTSHRTSFICIILDLSVQGLQAEKLALQPRMHGLDASTLILERVAIAAATKAVLTEATAHSEQARIPPTNQASPTSA